MNAFKKQNIIFIIVLDPELVWCRLVLRDAEINLA
jgi:hypothetical protein